MCVACRTTSGKRTFVRLVRSPDGRVEVDPTGKKAGRGAYLCLRRACWKQGVGRRLEQALRTSLAPEDREALLRFAASIPDDESDPGPGAPTPENRETEIEKE